MKFNIAWPIGLVLAFGFMLFGIVYTEEGVNFTAITNFWDPPSALITRTSTVAGDVSFKGHVTVDPQAIHGFTGGLDHHLAQTH